MGLVTKRIVFVIETGEESKRSPIRESEAFTSANRGMLHRRFEAGLSKEEFYHPQQKICNKSHFEDFKTLWNTIGYV